MSNIIEEDDFIENDDEMTYYEILNVIDDGELRTDWQVVNLSEQTIGEDHFRCTFTPSLGKSGLPWQMVFWINKQYFHLSVLRRNEPNCCPNGGILIKFDTYFSGINQLSTTLDNDDSMLNNGEGLNVQTISECFMKKTSSNNPRAIKHYIFEVNRQSVNITIMYSGDVAKIDFTSFFARNKNQMSMSYTKHNGEANSVETALRFHTEWCEANRPYI